MSAPRRHGALVAARACRKRLHANARHVPRIDERNAWTIPGVLRLGEDEEPDSLNLMYAHTAASDTVSGLLFSFILRFDAQGNYVPDLATQVPTLANGGISSDGKTIVVHLRKGVVWADGAPLTAADWLFTYRAVRNPANNVKTRYGWDEIASAGAPDPSTIVIRLKRPNVAVLGILAMGGAAYPPMPAHLLAKLPDLNSASFNQHPLSSGPYVLKEWNHGSSLVFRPQPALFSRCAEAQRGDLEGHPRRQHALQPARDARDRRLPDRERQLGSAPPERKRDRRQTAPDRELASPWHQRRAARSSPTCASAARSPKRSTGSASTIRSFTGSTSWPSRISFRNRGPRPICRPIATIRPMRAGSSRKPVGKAGTDGVLHKGALAMHLAIYATNGHQENTESQVLIQSMLRPVGIDVAVRNYPGSFLFAQNGPLYTGKYDLEWSIETNGPDPDNSGDWNGAFIPPNGANTSWLDDPIVNRTSAAAASTFDQAARKRLYQIEERRIRELVPAVFFSWQTNHTAMNSDVKGYVPAAFIGDSWNAWQWSI